MPPTKIRLGISVPYLGAANCDSIWPAVFGAAIIFSARLQSIFSSARASDVHVLVSVAKFFYTGSKSTCCNCCCFPCCSSFSSATAVALGVQCNRGLGLALVGLGDRMTATVKCLRLNKIQSLTAPLSVLYGNLHS